MRLCSALWLTTLLGTIQAASPAVDLRDAVILTRAGELPPAEKAAAAVLVEEIEKRTGIHLRTTTEWPARKTVIAVTAAAAVPGWSTIPRAPAHAEGYRLLVEQKPGAPSIVWLAGADARGTLFAAGDLLRKADWAKGKLSLAPLDISSAPAYAIRGHQLGYRAQANSYDAFTVAQYEQYIRELAFFGVNSIENIPFHDDRPTPVMKLPRREMNRAISDICYRYGLDYWVWVPADFDLNDKALRSRMLDRYREMFADCKQITGVFFPSGDPGSNPPELVMPFLEDVAKLMAPGHPEAKIWFALQQYSQEKIEASYRYFEQHHPQWLGGLVTGPSSPSPASTRARIAADYKLRLYPDLTHNKLCQYPVPGWDQAFALTLGREAVNPRPMEFAAIFHRTAAYSDGFLSYSDGVHDDVNKTIWSALSWDPQRRVRDILTEYARVYFEPAVAEEAADGILALEKNWQGPLSGNGAIEGTLLQWQHLEKRAARLESNWRWQMCLLRANYDAYVRRRLIHETALEAEANGILADAGTRGAEASMTAAMAVLNRAVDPGISPDLRARIADLCAKLFQSIGLQTSVEKYYASGEERGAVLDFMDYPLNNRWWLEEEFRKVRTLGSEPAKVDRLRVLAAWENPGPGSFYDNVGNASKSPHVMRDDPEAGEERSPSPTFWWWDEGKSRARLTWQATMWPRRMVYDGLDPNAHYVVRSSGYGQAGLRMNGEPVQPTVDGTQAGEFKEFPVPPAAIRNRQLVLTWERPTNEGKLNWRQRSRLAEVWLLKQPM